MYKVNLIDNGFQLFAGERLILEHSPAAPALYLGLGTEKIEMFRGNFHISDRISERVALRLDSMEKTEENVVLHFSHPDVVGDFRVSIAEENGYVTLKTAAEDKRCNRIWIRFCAEEREHVMGGGEQFSALDLRGRLFPIWTREQGVGRNKLTEVTRLADELEGAGGDYHTTFYPQPTFVSSRLYFVHLENYDYAELDFCAKEFHIILYSEKFEIDS